MGKINKAIYSHASDDWATPKAIYEEYMRKGFFDPCPLFSSFDGLNIKWPQNVFVNPPYSQLSKWIDKAIEEAKSGVYVEMLIPARTDTKAFSKLFEYGCTFVFLTGRLHFNEKTRRRFRR